MNLAIRPVYHHDFEGWFELRKKLWPQTAEAQHLVEMQHYLNYWDVMHAFIVSSPKDGSLVGFIEVSLRDRAEKSTTAPVGYIEGWYVLPGFRNQGIGKELYLAAESWVKSKGCSEIASDVLLEDEASARIHEELGFKSVAKLNHFLKELTTKPQKLGIHLETERLIVREAQFGDIDAIVKYLNDNKRFHTEYEAPRPHDYYTTQYWYQRVYSLYYRPQEDKSLQLFMFKKSDPSHVIGYANYYNIVYGAFYSCHVGYMLAESEQGHGYMQEALRAGIDYLFKVKHLHRVIANYMPKNKRSGKTLEKLGFEVDGKAKKYLFVNGKWEDHILTSLVNKNW